MASQDRQFTRAHRWQRLLIAGSVLVVVALAVAVGTAALGQRGSSSDTRTATFGGTLEPASTTVPASAESAATTHTASVEVPDLVGQTLGESRALLEALQLSLDVRALPASSDATVVTAQLPEAGAIVPAGTTVVVSLVGFEGERPTASGRIVVIDPGHQSAGDSTHEPIGPGATQTKPRVTSGTSGVVTNIPEFEVVLQISTNLKNRLEQAGVTVVMTRETNDVNISNAERAAIANEAGADLFVRIHAAGNSDRSIAGISVLYPGPNQWTGPIAQPSKRAAMLVQDATVAATGAHSRGVIARTDLSGFNWARVPSILVECGFMSNTVEDRLLSSPHYQDKLAEGITSGILAYLEALE